MGEEEDKTIFFNSHSFSTVATDRSVSFALGSKVTKIITSVAPFYFRGGEAAKLVTETVHF